MTRDPGYRVIYLNDRTVRMEFNDGTQQIVQASYPCHLQRQIVLAGRQHHFTIDPEGCIEEILTTELLGEDY